MNDVKDFRTMRITFSKTGSARYISHLDLNRTMTRAVRRAGLPIWYTEGFNRHPYLTFASPLSLGYEGEQETMDVRFADDMVPEELVQRLNTVMPSGLTILHAAWAVKKAGEVDRAVYRLCLTCCAEDVQALFAQEAILVEKRTKKKDYKTVDLKPAVLASDAVIEAGEGACTVTLTLPCNSTDTVNPSLIIEALKLKIGQPDLPCTVRRLAVLDKEGKIFA